MALGVQYFKEISSLHFLSIILKISSLELSGKISLRLWDFWKNKMWGYLEEKQWNLKFFFISKNFGES